MTLQVLAPAKINLFLKIVGRRPDGYHELVSLMCRVGLFDQLELDFTANGIVVECNHVDVPEDASNLAYKAAETFFKALKGVHPSGLPSSYGVLIRINKKIPVGAGLGGGSSNAASVLMALNQHWGKPFSRRELMQLGLQLGADVPFFIFEQPAIARGIGEDLRVYLGQLPRTKILLVYPEVGVSTAAVYKNLNFGLTKSKIPPKYSDFEKQDFIVAKHLFNDLEQVTVALLPIINTIKGKMLACGATGTLMSGSGSTVFGIFPDDDTAQKARHFFSAEDTWRVYLTEFIR